MSNDTIAAIATPPGMGGVGIIRISGPLCKKIADVILHGTPPPRHADYRSFYDAEDHLLDQGIAIYFPAPNSFTGEDVLELQGHGGPVVLDMLLQACVRVGVRIARSGEFSERAFLNDKMDLAQAEAIADLIESGSEQSARAALRSLQGDFSDRIHSLVADVTELRMYIESAIDFPEEEIDFLGDQQIHTHLENLLADFEQLQQSVKHGCLMREGMTVVIAGQPNAGKSSLLNVLAGRETAIVTEVPGTTRDVLREHIDIDGLPLHIVDTAGLRETDDQVEQIGVDRAWEAISHADRILMMVDDRNGITDADRSILEQFPEGLGLTIVRNKIDLSEHKPDLRLQEQHTEISLSATTGQGLELLREHLKQCVGYQITSAEGEFTARRRHLDALQRANQSLLHARTQLGENRAGELAAEELRQAQQALSEITGEFSSDDLLGKIFADFCIGK